MRKSNGKRRVGRAASLIVRLDAESKNWLAKAAELRGVSMSDYVRLVTVSQARNEVLSAQDRVISLTPEQQLAFWNALHAPVRLTPAQRRLGQIIRGERSALK